MAYELKDGQGSLFRVKEKKNERGPDYEGKVMIGETLWRLAGWIKEGRSGKYLSLKADQFRDRAALTGGTIGTAQGQVDDDIDW